VRGLNINIL